MRNKCSLWLDFADSHRRAGGTGGAGPPITGGQLTRTRRISNTCFEKHPVKNFGKRCGKCYVVPFTLKPFWSQNMPVCHILCLRRIQDVMIYLGAIKARLWTPSKGLCLCCSLLASELMNMSATVNLKHLHLHFTSLVCPETMRGEGWSVSQLSSSNWWGTSRTIGQSQDQHRRKTLEAS